MAAWSRAPQGTGQVDPGGGGDAEVAGGGCRLDGPDQDVTGLSRGSRP
jgi:hypothetical protein